MATTKMARPEPLQQPSVEMQGGRAHSQSTPSWSASLYQLYSGSLPWT
jgi:hypothetical protein